jgi:hypothetical protein
MNTDEINKKNKKDSLNFFLEALGFIQIVASPFLIGLAIGFGVYVSKSDNVGLVISISIASIGLVIGIAWAIKTRKKKDTTDYITTASSPDFDKFDKD